MPANQVLPPGDHDRCWLCGELRIDDNLAAAGEAACRVCGGRVGAKRDPQSIERTKNIIRGLAGEIQQLGCSDYPPEELGPAFLSRVVKALAACGGSLWRAPKKGVWFNTSEPTIEHSIGPRKGSEFAAKVIRENVALVIPGNDFNSPFLLVGVPISEGESVCGALEVLQRPDAGQATQRGYLRFAQQMVELITPGNKLFA